MAYVPINRFSKNNHAGYSNTLEASGRGSSFGAENNATKGMNSTMLLKKDISVQLIDAGLKDNQ